MVSTTVNVRVYCPVAAWNLTTSWAGKMFATLTRAGAFVVKLPRQRVAALVADGQGKPFEPGPGRVMTEWLELSAPSGQDWTSLAEEALAFVVGVPE